MCCGRAFACSGFMDVPDLLLQMQRCKDLEYQMGDSDRWSAKLGEFRRKAEQILGSRHRDDLGGADLDLVRLVEELEVHQMELQLQNEELRSARKALEESGNHYAQLYNDAPVGYVNLNRRGVVTRCNVAAGRILGINARRRFRYPFASFVHAEDQGKYRALVHETVNSAGGEIL